MRLLIFGGSLEFITVEMLLSPFAPLQVFIMALLIQARHLFYGISMLEKFKGTGWKKFFLIFGMCDETFSINYTAKIPEDVDKGWFLPFAIFNEKDQLLHSCSISENCCLMRYSVCWSFTALEMWI